MFAGYDEDSDSGEERENASTVQKPPSEASKPISTEKPSLFSKLPAPKTQKSEAPEPGVPLKKKSIAINSMKLAGVDISNLSDEEEKPKPVKKPPSTGSNPVATGLFSSLPPPKNVPQSAAVVSSSMSSASSSSTSTSTSASAATGLGAGAGVQGTTRIDIPKKSELIAKSSSDAGQLAPKPFYVPGTSRAPPPSATSAAASILSNFQAAPDVEITIPPPETDQDEGSGGGSDNDETATANSASTNGLYQQATQDPYSTGAYYYQQQSDQSGLHAYPTYDTAVHSVTDAYPATGPYPSMDAYPPNRLLPPTEMYPPVGVYPPPDHIPQSLERKEYSYDPESIAPLKDAVSRRERKRNRQPEPQDLLEVNAASFTSSNDVKIMDTPSSYQGKPAKGEKPNKVQKQRNQLTYLAWNNAQKASELEEKRANSSRSKRETMSKYGW